MSKNLWCHQTTSQSIFVLGEKCDFKTIHPSSLVGHMKMQHDGNTEFKCEVCGKMFYRQYMLDIHILSHSDERNYMCHVCGASFKSQQDLNNHGRNAHFGKNKFECVKCATKFIDKSKAHRHILTHADECGYECSACEEKFKNPSNCRLHVIKVHNKQGSTRMIMPYVKELVKVLLKDIPEEPCAEDQSLIKSDVGEPYFEQSNHPEESDFSELSNDIYIKPEY